MCGYIRPHAAHSPPASPSLNVPNRPLCHTLNHLPHSRPCAVDICSRRQPSVPYTVIVVFQPTGHHQGFGQSVVATVLPQMCMASNVNTSTILMLTSLLCAAGQLCYVYERERADPLVSLFRQLPPLTYGWYRYFCSLAVLPCGSAAARCVSLTSALL